jgi:hypothetical protein
MTAASTVHETDKYAWIDDELDLLAWRGWVKLQHRRINAWACGNRLSEPEVEFATLDPGVRGTYRHSRDGQAMIRLDLNMVNLIPFLGDAYAGKLAQVRILDVLRHEMAHQYEVEIDGVQFTDDDPRTDHGFTFVDAALRLGATPARHCTPWLWR